jgi:TP901 family phage tail tape measure protein
VANYDLGTATGTISIKYDKNGGAAKAKADVEGVGESAKKASVTSKELASGLAKGGAVIAGGLALAVNSAANFEQRLSAIKAVSGATAGEMEKVRAKALQIGKDTAFSATDAAQAMEELSKAGISTSDILNGAADATVALAAAGEIALPKAAEISSNALNQFALQAKDLPRVADLIAGAANASAIDVSDFGQSLSQVGAVAHLAGLSFDDTAVAIAEMGNAGVKGSDAGTSLKTFLSNLQPTTKAATKALEEMGIITKDGTNLFYDQTGKLKSLRDIQQLLNDGTKNYTAAQKQAALQTIFGSDAIRAAAVLAGEGSKGFDDLSKSMNKVKAADVAATKLDNFKGSLEQLKGSSETLAIQVGTLLLPTIRDIVDALNAAVGWFSSLSPQMQKTAVYAAAAAASFLLFGAGVIKAVEFAQKFSAALKVIGGLKFVAPVLQALRVGFLAAASGVRAFTVALLTNPIGLIIVAIIALVAAIVLLWKNSETFRNIVKAVWAAVKSAIGAVADWFTGTIAPSFMKAVNDVVGFFQGLWSALVSIWNGIKSVISTSFQFIVNLIINYVKLITLPWRTAWNIFGPIVKAALELVLVTIQLVMTAILVVILNVVDQVVKFWKFQWDLIKTVVVAVWNFIKPFVQAAINFILNVIKTGMNVVKSVWTTVWNAIKLVVTTTWNLIKSIVSAATNVIRSVITSAMNTIRSIISSVMNAVAGIFRSVWNSQVVSAVRNGVSTLIGIVNSIRSKVISAVSGAGRWLYNAGRQIIQGLLDGINAMIGKVRGALNSLTGLIPDWKGPASKDKVLLEQNGELIMQGLLRGLQNEVGPLRTWLSNLTTDIPTSFVDPRLAQPNQSLVRALANATAPVASGANVTVNNYNPVAEKDSVQTTRSLTRVAQLGVLG